MTKPLRFEFRVVDDNGETVVTDYTTITTDMIDQFGGCETVDHHVASTLRFLRRKAMKEAA